MPAADDIYRKELQSEIKLVLEMTARVDERVKLVVEKQSEMTQRLNGFIDSHNALSNRVTTLEAKNGNGIYELKNRVDAMIERVVRVELDPTKENVERIEKAVEEVRDLVDDMKKEIVSIEKRVHSVEDSQEGAWANARYAIDLAVKAIWALALGYVLYKTGWTAPTTPH